VTEPDSPSVEDVAIGDVAVDDVVARLRAKVDERRRAGLYPPGLEEDLDLHFHHIAVRGVRDRLKRLEDAFAEVERRGSALHAARIGTESQRAAGSVVHKAVARLVARQVEGVLTQVREYADAVAEAQRAVVLLASDLESKIDELRDRVLAVDPASPEASQRVLADLLARVDALEAVEARRRVSVWSEGVLAPAPGDEARWAAIAKQLPNEGPVLLAGAQWPAAILDAAGIDWRPLEGDPLVAVDACPPGEAGAVLLAQVFEPLSPRDQIALVARLHAAVAPGGRVVTDLRNPYAVGRGEAAGAASHPAYVSFLFREAGFTPVEVVWDGGGEAGAEAHLLDVVFGARSATVVATRP